MKRLLSILGSIGLMATTGATVVACDSWSILESNINKLAEKKSIQDYINTVKDEELNSFQRARDIGEEIKLRIAKEYSVIGFNPQEKSDDDSIANRLNQALAALDTQVLGKNAKGKEVKENEDVSKITKFIIRIFVKESDKTIDLKGSKEFEFKAKNVSSTPPAKKLIDLITVTDLGEISNNDVATIEAKINEKNLRAQGNYFVDQRFIFDTEATVKGLGDYEGQNLVVFFTIIKVIE